MNDVERDLRELFHEKAREATSAPTALREVLRRGRRRQAGTVLVAGLVALAAVGGSVAALSPLLRDDSTGVGGALPTTTRTINGITITYPEEWFAADPREAGLERADTPRPVPYLALFLAPEDPRVTGYAFCPGVEGAKTGNVLMTVQETPLALSGDASAPWPVALSPQDIDPAATEDAGCYGGWTLTMATWTAAGRSFEAHVGVGPAATDAERAAISDAFESMRFSPPVPGAPEVIEVASGTAFDGTTWSLKVSREEGPACFSFETPNHGFGTCTATATATAGVEVEDSPSVGILDAGRDGAFAVGTVPSEVDAVVLETNGGDVIGDIGLFDAPDGFGSDRYVVIPLPGEDRGLIRFHGAGRHDLYPPQPIDWRKEALSAGGAGSASGGGAATSAPSPVEGT